MKQLTCEMCGSTDLMKQDGVFVCQSCGCKYSVEEAKKMMVEGTVDVSGSTVKLDTSVELDNLYQIARQAKASNDAVSAEKYYDMIRLKESKSWEAAFYVVYFRAMQCKIGEIGFAATSVKNCIDTVLHLILENVSDLEQRQTAYTEVGTKVMHISKMLYEAVLDYFGYGKRGLESREIPKFFDNIYPPIFCVFALGDSLDALFGAETNANKLSVEAWKQGIEWLDKIAQGLTAIREKSNALIKKYAEKIKQYDTSFDAPAERSNGCYVATAVYGAYDCPQVWTLRRYRDYTLAESWYGRAFIHTYYAISPTLVKWFGHTEWFKKMWKGKLDRMVANLNSAGVKDTPYEDRKW